MKYKWQVLGGLCTTILMWLVLLLSDAVNEYILKTNNTVSGIVFFAAPLALVVWYIVHVIRTRPAANNIFIWHGSYILSFLPVWYAAYDSVNYHQKFIIPQTPRDDFLDLNGIELMFYGFSALVAFYIMVGAFHIVYAIILAVRKNRSA